MIVLFHGSGVEVTEPDIGRSRTEIDFGTGFYLTEDEIMASKWVCSKNRSVINKEQGNFCWKSIEVIDNEL